MRILFLGSPKFVIPAIEAIINSNNMTLCGVISQPAKPSGRKKVLTDPPVASYAKERNLSLQQPININSPESLQAIRALNADLALTASYGQILSQEFLDIFPKGCINIHPSALPLYRGASPIASAILDDLDTSAVTILYTVKKLDAGNIILQKPFPLARDKTAEELTAQMFSFGADMLENVIEKISAGDKGVPQDNSKATHCRKIAKAQGIIDWNTSVRSIQNIFRAFTPWPGTKTSFNSQPVDVVDVVLSNPPSDDVGPEYRSEVGTWSFSKKHKALIVNASDGYVFIRALKPSGKKVMDAASYCNGLGKKAGKFDLI